MQLTDEQFQACTAPGNVVLYAGPGSGKTLTLVAKALKFLNERPSRFQRVACITYTNAAAVEISDRLARAGADIDSAFVGTLHSLCLHDVVLPFWRLSKRDVSAMKMITDEDAMPIIRKAYALAGASKLNPSKRRAIFTQIRRAVHLRENLTQYDIREVAAVREYRRLLKEGGQFDFDRIVEIADYILRHDDFAVQRLTRRYPLILIDEYQDLGGVLHSIVRRLSVVSGVQMFCVGDPDQSIFGFAGADPEYMKSLDRLEGFEPRRLTRNFRSHKDIVAASKVALKGPLRMQAAMPGAALRVSLVNGWLDVHAEAVARTVVEFKAAGVELDDIAVLYPRKGALLELMTTQFRQSNLPFVFERDASIPLGGLADWLREAASKSVLLTLLGRGGRREAGPLVARSRSLSFDVLLRRFNRLVPDQYVELSAMTRISALRTLRDGLEGWAPDACVGPWFDVVAHQLDLQNLAHRSRDARDLVAFKLFREDGDLRSLPLRDLCDRSPDGTAFTLTTFHTAKGREFGHVIIPGLVSGIVPADVPGPSGWGAPIGADLDEARRGFYVALSRAKLTLTLIGGEIGGPEWKKRNVGLSPFLL